MSLDLRKELETILDAFYEDAKPDTPYPYRVFSLRRISENDGMQLYNLEINVWDQHPYYSRAENIMDAIEAELHRCNSLSGTGLVRFFKGQRQTVPDQDKTIKRVREQFELHVYERED